MTPDALLDAARAVAHLIDAEAAEHESAHVVAVWVRGGVVERVFIDEVQPYGGRTRLAEELAPDDRAPVALAGPIAVGSSESDERLSVELVGEDGLASARERARAIVDEHRSAIEVVARALVAARTLDRDAPEELRREVVRPG